MTILFKGLDHEQIKSYVLQSFSSSNERFHPYNYYLAHLLARKKNADLKHYTSLDSTSVSPSSYSFLFDNLSQEDKNFAIDYYNQTTSCFDSSHLLYLYHGPSSAVFSNIFSDILPSDFNHLYFYLIENNLLKKIGTNLGKAHIFSSQIAYHDFSTFTSAGSFTSYTEAVDAMVNEMSDLKKDISHLLYLLDQKDLDILNLQNKITEINHRNYIASTFTWS